MRTWHQHSASSSDAIVTAGQCMKVPDAEVSDEAQVEVMWHVLLVSAVV